MLKKIVLFSAVFAGLHFLAKRFFLPYVEQKINEDFLLSLMHSHSLATTFRNVPIEKRYSVNGAFTHSIEERRN